MRLKRLPLVLLVSLGSPAVLPADEIAISPRGEYARIDVRLANETITALLTGTDAQRARTIKAVEATPQRYAPPVFYALAKALFDEGRKDDGAFWFYAGQLRARFDANRCVDVSARQAVAVLNQEFGPPINQYMFKDLAKLEALIPKVVDWDRKTSHDYDHRWINLHGMDAMMESLDSASSKPKSLSLPKEQWRAIGEKTRADYLDGLQKAIVMAKAQAAASRAPTVRAELGWERRLPGTWKMDVSSMLPRMGILKDFPGEKPGEAGVRAMAERNLLTWTVGPDTIDIAAPGVEASRRLPPVAYRIVKVEGNVATLQMTPREGAAYDWTLEYLEPDVIRLVDGPAEVYRLRRVTAAAPRRR